MAKGAAGGTNLRIQFVHGTVLLHLTLRLVQDAQARRARDELLALVFSVILGSDEESIVGTT